MEISNPLDMDAAVMNPESVKTIEILDGKAQGSISEIQGEELGHDSTSATPPVLLSWKDVNVDTSEGHSLLLGSQQGTIRQGEILALMGLSGSGKSTLINALVSGAQPKMPSTMSKGCSMQGSTVTAAPGLRIGYCQDSSHTRILESLTVRQWLRYRAIVGAPTSSEAHLNTRLKQVTYDLGLNDQKVLDTRMSLISAGERVRAVIASEMLIQRSPNEPQVLICDEPLSALDSATSLQVMRTLRSLVEGTNKAVIMSLHQPRPEVFRLCDNVMLLHKGYQVYFGPREQAMATVRRNCLDSDSTEGFILDPSTYTADTDHTANFLLDAMVISSLSPAEMAGGYGAGNELSAKTTETSWSINSETSAEILTVLEDETKPAEPQLSWIRIRQLLNLIFLLMWLGRYGLLKAGLVLLMANTLLGAIAWKIGDTYGSVFLVVCVIGVQTGFVAQGLPAITRVYTVLADDIFCRRQCNLVFSIAFLLLALLQSIVHVVCSLAAYFMGGLPGGSDCGVFLLSIFGYMMFLTSFMYQSLAVFTHRGWTYEEVLIPSQFTTIFLPVVLEFAAGIMIPYALTASPFLGFALINPLGSAVRAILRHRQDQLQLFSSQILLLGSSSANTGTYYGIGSSVIASDQSDTIIEEFFFRLFDTTYNVYVYILILHGLVFALIATFCYTVHLKCKRKMPTAAGVFSKLLGPTIFFVLIFVSLAKLDPMREEVREFGISSDITTICSDCLNGFPSNNTLATLLNMPEVLVNFAIRDALLTSAREGAAQNTESGLYLPSFTAANLSWLTDESDFWDLVPNAHRWPETKAKELVSLDNAEGRLALSLLDIGFPQLEQLKGWNGDLSLDHHLSALNDSLVTRLNVTASKAMASGRLYFWKPCPGGDDLERNSLSANASDNFKTVNARVLFYHQGNGTLITVAVQLGNDNMPLLLPDKMADSRCWDIARTHPRHAMSVLGGGMRHLMHMHTVAGAFAIATRQALPEDHPVSWFLLPHLSPNSILDNGLTLLNDLDVLPVPGLSLRQALPVVKGLSRDYHFLRATNLTDVYNRQGLRQIGTPLMPTLEAIWKAALKYAHRYVERHIPSDSSVAKDQDIQQWTRALTLANVHGLTMDGKNHLRTRAELATVLAGVLSGLILDHSVGHSGAGRDSLYIPHVPFAVRSTYLPGPSSQCSLEDQLYLYGEPDNWLDQIKFWNGVMMATPTHIGTARTDYTADLFDDFVADLQEATELIADPWLRNSLFRQLSGTQHL